MVTSLTVHCDRCGSTILTDRTVLRVDSGPLRSRLDTGDVQQHDSVDLCSDCGASWLSWLRKSELEDAGVVAG